VATHLSGVKLKGRSGCTILRVPSLQLLTGQFLVPVVMLDGEGVHRYHEFLMPENLTGRNYTKEVGLMRLAHEWLQSDAPVPALQRPPAKPAP